MRAVILVGGEATRLRPLTCNLPKALVPVLNAPFLEHVIRYLSRYQVTDIILAQSRLTQRIKDYFGDGSQLGVKLSYTSEDTPLGTAGGVKIAEPYLDETFLVLNGDIITSLDIRDMVNFHQESKAKATIALTRVEDPTSYGSIETNHQNRVTRFLEKPRPDQISTNMINAGTYVLEPEALRYIPPQTNFSFERQLFPLLLEKGEPVYAYHASGYWIDIGTPAKYLQLHRDLLSGKNCPGQYGFTTGEEVVVGERSVIDPAAQIKGPVLVGSNCTIGRRVKLEGPVVIGSGCKISEEAIIEESVIWQRVQIDERVRVRSAVIANNCHLHPDCGVTDGSLLGDNVVIARGYKLKPASRILPGTVVGI